MKPTQILACLLPGTQPLPLFASNAPFLPMPAGAHPPNRIQNYYYPDIYQPQKPSVGQPLSHPADYSILSSPTNWIPDIHPTPDERRIPTHAFPVVFSPWDYYKYRYLINPKLVAKPHPLPHNEHIRILSTTHHE